MWWASPIKRIISERRLRKSISLGFVHLEVEEGEIERGWLGKMDELHRPLWHVYSSHPILSITRDLGGPPSFPPCLT